jgi:hypothetical protein
LEKSKKYEPLFLVQVELPVPKENQQIVLEVKNLEDVHVQTLVVQQDPQTGIPTLTVVTPPNLDPKFSPLANRPTQASTEPTPHLLPAQVSV